MIVRTLRLDHNFECVGLETPALAILLALGAILGWGDSALAASLRIHDAIAAGQAAQHVDRSPCSCSANGLTPFSESPRGALLVGFDIDLGREGLAGLRPIYRTAQGPYSTRGLGSFAAGKTTFQLKLEAKPGYAIGGIRVKQSDGVRAISLVFRKLNGLKLDENDSYETGWAGNTRAGDEVLLDSHESVVIGVHGFAEGEAVLGIGLICLRAAEGAEPPSATILSPGDGPVTLSSVDGTDSSGFFDSLMAPTGNLLVPLIMFGLVTAPVLVFGVIMVSRRNRPRHRLRPFGPPPWVATGARDLPKR